MFKFEKAYTNFLWAYQQEWWIKASLFGKPILLPEYFMTCLNPSIIFKDSFIKAANQNTQKILNSIASMNKTKSLPNVFACKNSQT